MSLKIQQTEILDVLKISSEKFTDGRGFFLEKYKKSDFDSIGINCDFVQLNHSFSKKGVLRGLHIQRWPKEQGKLVTVVKGKILDVAVDIRPNSTTFKKYAQAILSDENNMSLWIPKGFAHGFFALDDSNVIYLATDEFSIEHDSGIRWDDPEINIKWPTRNPTLSEKDKNLKTLNELVTEGVL